MNGLTLTRRSIYSAISLSMAVALPLRLPAAPFDVQFDLPPAEAAPSSHAAMASEHEAADSHSDMSGPMMGQMMMDDMLRHMGPYTRRELYPSLMQLPTLPPDKQSKIKQQAHARMQSGLEIVTAAQQALLQAEANDDLLAMQTAAADVRAGTAQYESGVAALRALEAGQAPREIALRWFRNQMNLDSPIAAHSDTLAMGMSPFHLAICGFLLLFAGAMVWMYVLRLQRASQLMQALTHPGRPSSAAAPNRPPPSQSPLPPSKSTTWNGPLRVAAVYDETPTVKTIRLVPPAGGDIPFRFLPGQFLRLHLEVDGASIKRPYTIASSPTRSTYVEVTVKREAHGLASRHLHDRIRPGDLIHVAAPHGTFTFTGTEHDSIVLVGGGVGITPLMSVVRSLTDNAWQNDVYFLYSCTTADEFIFRQELEYLRSRHPRLHLAVTFSRETEPIDGYRLGRIDREFIAGAVPDIAAKRIHICGTSAMAESISTMLHELGVSPDAIKYEAFGTAKRAPQTHAPSPAAPSEKLPDVTFKVSEKTTPIPPQQSILEAAEDVGVPIDSACRSGTCGTCKVPLSSGDVTMAVTDALTPADRRSGMILACQAHANTNVTVEA